jgi:hypothetical protein
MRMTPKQSTSPARNAAAIRTMRELRALILDSSALFALVA